MKIYVRKIDEQCITHQISFRNVVWKEFFNEAMEFTACGVTSGYSEKVKVLPSTDLRFDAGLSHVIASEGNIEVGDILVIYKDNSKYDIELVKPNNNKYNYVKELCERDQRHTLIDIESGTLNGEDRKEKFKNWLLEQRKLSDITIGNYVRYIDYIKEKGYTDYDLYLVMDISIIVDLINKFKTEDSYIQYNQDNNRTPSSALIQYKKFLDNLFDKDLSTYYTENLFNNSLVEKSIEERNKFVTEYPISRIMEMTKEEYCLGHDNSQDSFCNILEKGEYAHTGFGIGGANASKFGIYLKKDGKYHGKNDVEIENVEEYWDEFKKQLCSFLMEMSNSEPNFEIDKKYPLLGGPGGYMYLTKLLSLYYPDKYISMSKKEVYKKLGDYFKCDIYDNSVANSFYLNKVFREEIPQSKENDGYYISNAVWKYFDKESSELEEVFEPISGAYNMIYYGTPGCGKSYKVNKDFNDNNYIVYRTTFHPEYSNSDFVGQIIPKTENGEIKYEFQEGTFTLALYEALKNPSKRVCLIIEEINRGNASAIFGDIFQLLDRERDGSSVYSINNEPIKNYLNKNGVKVDKIKIPSNMWIIATMNTSDQNVFTLDTAFKRRWRMHRIINEFNKEEAYDNKLASMYIPGSSYTWEQFIITINNAIMDKNPTGLNSEDKQLGVYFVTENELSAIPVNDDKEAMDRFIEKVLLYIWDDVAKLDTTLWFDHNINSFDELVKSYYDNKLHIFKDMFKDQNNESQVEEINERN